MFGTGMNLGRLFGIRVRVDASLLIIFALVVFNLGAGVFPHWHADWGLALTWGVALGAAILFFLSVLAHEMAHSLVARAYGIPVRSITLFLFGGVSDIQREPPSPKSEFVMAAAGPLTSIGLGFLLLWLAGLASNVNMADVEQAQEAFAALGPGVTLLVWLGTINIILGFFNLIPGFPLDGGRVLRAILWGATGDLMKASRWAAMIGQLTGWAFIGVGVAMVFGIRVPIFGTGLVSGLWLAFIGWFLSRAAAASFGQVVIRNALEDVPVERVMSTDAARVPAGLSLEDLVDDWMMRTDQRAFPVEDEDGHVVGLVCLDDVRNVPRGDRPDTRVRDVMTPTERLTTLTPRDSAADAFLELSRNEFGQIPIVDRGQWRGFVRRQDILRWLELHADMPGPLRPAGSH
ncbi:MAG: site-2 protease family protein [Myxococcota bacterium]